MVDFEIRDLSQKEMDTLESLIDSAGLESVLNTLSEICYEKADHVEATWQDGVLARSWCTAAAAISGITPKARHL